MSDSAHEDFPEDAPEDARTPDAGGAPAQDGTDFLAARFESHRGHLRAVAYRMLGSLTEADDAVQEAWLKLSRADSSRVDNLGGWLTTVVGRVCLDMLRSRRTRGEEPLEPSAEGQGVRMPEPVVSSVSGADPEQEALLADSVGLALLVVLETLTPAERLSFVLHDLFAVPFDEIAAVLGRTPAASRQLASRARRRVQGGAPVSDADPGRQREVVDAFLAAAREGDFEALVAVLDPDVVARSEGGVTAGAVAVASGASSFAHLARIARPALVNGVAGLVVVAEGRPAGVLAFTVVHGRIAVIDIVNDPERLAGLDVTVLDH
ncbi:sigma-70 family RNA polymerase sigma factor [Streptomyces sp. NPDC002688]|uniref:sigma-70 family RNA polymerase sigma factor n=1 Tax=Streptomyces sp. NPDC002688 TaxID=3154423 RepID=UPI00332124ED